MSAKRDYYEVLGVPRDVDDASLKKAYRQIALKFHPDRNPGDKEAEERFKEAAEAYGVLSDTEKRQSYDRFGHAGVGGGGGAGYDVNDVFANFGDIFAELFGGGAGRGRSPRGPSRGDDLQITVEVPFEFAIHGGVRQLEIPRSRTCATCSGSGAAPGSEPVVCRSCGGHGQVRHSQGLFTIQTTCAACRGRGQTISKLCPDCDGRGAVRASSKVDVKVPAGIESGNRLRIRGEGQAGRNGGPSGDLYVLVAVADSDIFRRDGADLHLSLPIDFTIAALGGSVEIPTLSGNQVVEIDSGTQPGTRIRRAGLGLPRLQRDGNGDLYVHVEVEVPRKLNKRQRELLEELAREGGVSTSGRHGFWDRLAAIFEPGKTGT